MATESSGAVESPSSLPLRAALLTFLIADVRGYTRFTAEQGDEAAARLAGRFAAIAQQIAAGRGGEVIELRGDEALAVFASARQALRAALDLQQRFAQERAADPSLPLRVGIGLDAGEAIPVEGGYRGGAINLAARLCSIAGAGEVFCSETVISLARKTEGIAFVDRGEVILKGLTSPVRVIQIAPEGELPAALPPLQPLLVTHPNNLPDEPTPFIGREQEIEQIAALLQDPHIRLVTLTGPGGTGKTRLALQVGSTLLHDFSDGVFFVNLAPLTDSALIPSAIAEVLGVKEEAGRGLVETLTEALQDRHLLLVLDNFEHVLDGSSVVAPLVDRCRDLHVLVTSRIPLHLSREHEHLVPPLSVPDPNRLPDLATLSQYESVALFIERAKAAKDSFTVTDDNAPAVAEICYRLDGLPLAVELAAARIKLFPPQALLQRLSSRLKLLTGGAKDRPTRQQTLRGAIDWSYSLLSPEEQTLFARLSVFAGGCSFEAAEVVCNPAGDLDLLEGMASLVDKSLVHQDEGPDGEPRFRMLETIREYAAEKLDEHGETESMRGQHARYFINLPSEVGVGDPGQWGPEHPHGLKQLEAELDNLRAALEWCQARGEGQLGLRLVCSLFWLWELRGFFAEGRRWADALLAHRDRADRQVQARTLWVAGVMTARVGKVELARGYFEESLALFQEVGDTRGSSWALLWLGNVAAHFGDHEGAAARYEAGREAARQDSERWVAAIASHNLGQQVRRQGDLARAQELHEEALAVFRETGHGSYVSRALYALAAVALEQGQLERGKALLVEAFQAADQAGDRAVLILCLVATAGLAVQQEEGSRAGWLLGAAEAAHARTGAAWDPGRVAEAARAQVSETTWRTAWQEGWVTPLDQAVAAATAYAAGEEVAPTAQFRSSVTDH